MGRHQATNKKADDFLRDSFGQRSSKRVWGSIIVGFGSMAGVCLFIVSVFFGGAGDPATAISIINSFLLFGGSLLGIGVIEKFAIKK
jgi:VIT1/CCC1 family predicted Fe2+/Mn2+ transporter